jgi:hypothetical protein
MEPSLGAALLFSGDRLIFDGTVVKEPALDQLPQRLGAGRDHRLLAAPILDTFKQRLLERHVDGRFIGSLFHPVRVS